MENLKSRVNYRPVKLFIEIDEEFYIKDPHSSDLGLKILSNSITMMDEIGYEAFTFKKLANQINSTEASIYRYFEGKLKLLLYLLDWYWNWMDYKITLATDKTISAEERLKIALKLLTQPIENDPNFDYIDERALYRLVVSESSKVYLNKEVDKANKKGLFFSYKRVCIHVSSIVSEINPDYRYPKALISTVIESSHDQKYFAEHLPSLTDFSSAKLNETTTFLTDLVFSAIKKN